MNRNQNLRMDQSLQSLPAVQALSFFLTILLVFTLLFFPLPLAFAEADGQNSEAVSNTHYEPDLHAATPEPDSAGLVHSEIILPEAASNTMTAAAMTTTTASVHESGNMPVYELTPGDATQSALHPLPAVSDSTTPPAIVADAPITSAASVAALTLSAITPSVISPASITPSALTPPAVTAAGISGPSIVPCSSARELVQFLEKNSGGAAVLTEDIIWDKSLSGISIKVTRPVVILMAQHSIHIPRTSSLFLYGPIHFERGGTEQSATPEAVPGSSQTEPEDIPRAESASLSVPESDGLAAFDGLADTAADSEKNDSSTPFFSVEGYLELGKGASLYLKENNSTAILVRTEGSAFFPNLSLTGSEIIVEGENVVAVTVEGGRYFTLFDCRITASGANSVGIRAEGPVCLELCSITAGSAAVESSSDDIRLDGCFIWSPQLPAGAEIISRQAVSFYRIEQNGICIPAGATREELAAQLAEYKQMPYVLYDPVDEASSEYLFTAADVSWLGLPEDLNVPGSYMVTAVPSPPSPWFPVKLPSLTVPIRVIDPAVPAILRADDNGSCASLRFFSSLDQASEIDLLYAVDQGPWLEAEALSYTAMTAEGAVIGPLESNHTYRFRLSVTGGPVNGISESLTFHFYDLLSLNSGGNRDGDDRGDQGELPDVDNSTSQPNKGGSSHRPDAGSSGGGTEMPNPNPSEISTSPVPPENAGASEGSPAIADGMEHSPAHVLHPDAASAAGQETAEPSSPLHAASEVNWGTSGSGSAASVRSAKDRTASASVPATSEGANAGTAFSTSDTNSASNSAEEPVRHSAGGAGETVSPSVSGSYTGQNNGKGINAPQGFLLWDKTPLALAGISIFLLIAAVLLRRGDGKKDGKRDGSGYGK